MSDIEFVNGLIVKAPHDRAPDFVKASISIKRVELMEWLAGRGDEWVNVDVKESKSGKWYAAVNTYKRDDAGQPKPRNSKPVKDCPQPDQGGFTDDDLDDIPFN